MKKYILTLFVVIVSALLTNGSGDLESCLEAQFKCRNGKCIPASWRCDAAPDCGLGDGDKSDEENCSSKTCPTDEFQCFSGQCILQKWKCDGEADCNDGSDEFAASCNGTKCTEDEFRCNTGQCISNKWRCDGSRDCPDGEDETCDSPTCAEDEMRCNNSKCVTKKWICDGEDDCGDKSDEVNCTSSCPSDQFKCHNNKCIDKEWHCDGENDCDDNSDEMNCTNFTTKNKCSEEEWACLHEEQCILKDWHCDGDTECYDGSDEENCNYTCSENQFQCKSGPCIDYVSKCDDIPDCTDGSDEDPAICKSPVSHCPENHLDCFKNGKKCIDYVHVCDGINNCGGWEDETADLCHANQCKTNNGGCDHICEPLDDSKYRCACNTGYKLNGTKHCININECVESDIPVCSQICEDVKGHYKCSCVKGYKLESLLGRPEKTTCKIDGPRPWLLFANKQDVRKMEVGTWLLEPVVDDLISAVSVAYYKDKYVYWSDVRMERISRAPLNHSSTVIGQKKKIIDTNILTADGIAIDWIHDLLYWTDTGYNSIQVSSLEGDKKATVISEMLDEPRGITLDPHNGYMYITDWGKNPKIEKIGMDGSDRKAIVTDVVWPNGITIDHIDNRIYWVDAKLHIIKSANMDGSGIRNVIHNAKHIAHPFSVAVFEDFIYWTDWSSDSIRKAHKYTGEDYQQVALGLHSPMDIKILHESIQKPGHSACLQNGGCEYLCLPSPRKQSVSILAPTCTCPDNQVLDKNKYSCIPKVPTDIPSTINPVKSTIQPVKSTTLSPNSSNKNHSTKGVVPATKPVTTEVSPTTPKPIVVVTTSGPGYTTFTEKHNKTEEVPKSKEEHVGIVAFVAIGVVAFIIVVFAVIGCFVYRRVMKRNIKSMNFDNPVYRKTTTTEDSIMIGHQRDNHHVHVHRKGDNSEIKPLTQDV